MSLTEFTPVTSIRKVLTWTALSVLLVMAGRPVQAQTETVLYNFPGGPTSSGPDGGIPESGLASDAAGNFYGSTLEGGAFGYGTVYELSPNGGGGWNQTVLHSFTLGADGGYPWGPLMFDGTGNLYGTTSDGPNGYGVAFELSPSGTGWTEIVLYNFADGPGGGQGPACGLLMDSAGNLYGTFSYDTNSGKVATQVGSVFELRLSGGVWTEQVLYSITLNSNGDPLSPGLTRDALGNLYGSFTTTIFELSPNGDGGWTPTVIHTFPKNFQANSPLVLDQAGNLYGTTFYGGANGAGMVYRLSLGKTGAWTLATLHAFGSAGDGSYSAGGIVFDAVGNLYGTTVLGGANGGGTVYELAPVGKNKDKYDEQILWSFNSTDGFAPLGALIQDSAGNMYGTTAAAGTSAQGQFGYGIGVIFEVTP